MGNRKSDLRCTRRGVFLCCILLSLGSFSSGDEKAAQAANSDRATPAASRNEMIVDIYEDNEDRPARLSLVPTVVHAGEAQVDGAEYLFFLGCGRGIVGRLNRHTAVLLIGPKEGGPVYQWGGGQLNATHRLGRRYYRFSCTPSGSRLFVRPYDGPLGTLEVGAGRRKVEQLEIQGSLHAKDTTVAVGDGMENGWPKATRRCELPVGDYQPAGLTIRMDDLGIEILRNYLVNVQEQPGTAREPVYGIKIRQDKPYVLDFANRPTVQFTQPGDKERVHPGSLITIKAVLVDPVLDIMIRGLNDLTQIETTTVTMADGRQREYKSPRSLAPKVLIKRADGEIVAQGEMPFG